MLLARSRAASFLEISADQIGAFDLNLLGGWPKTSRNSREKCEAVSNPTNFGIEIVFSMRLSKTMSAALNRDYSRLSKKSVAV
jgi:hypothetical protein